MFSRSNGSRQGRSYLQLSQGETTASTNTAVVLDGGAAHNGTQLVDGTGSDGSGLGDTVLTSAVLTTGLNGRMLVHQVRVKNFSPKPVVGNIVRRERECSSGKFSKSYLVEVHADALLPILAEVCKKCISTLIIHQIAIPVRCSGYSSERES